MDGLLLALGRNYILANETKHLFKGKGSAVDERVLLLRGGLLLLKRSYHWGKQECGDQANRRATENWKRGHYWARASASCEARIFFFQNSAPG